MQDNEKSKEQLILELQSLKKKIKNADKKNTLKTEAEKAFRQSMKWYRLIMEGSLDAVFIADQNGRISDLNQYAALLTGYSRTELMRMSITDLYDSSDIKTFKRIFDRTMSGKSVIGKAKIISKNPKAIETKFHIRRISVEKENFIHLVIRNISAQKKTEKEKQKLITQLNRAQKMETIGALAGGIAHDFNNILSVIMGYIEIALYNDLPENSEAVHNLKQATQAGHRAKDLIKQILLFNDQKEYTQKPLHISPIIRETLGLIRATLPTTIEIRNSIKENTGKIMADPAQIHQLLLNLSTLVTQSMNNTGILYVSLKNIYVKSEDMMPVPDMVPGHYIELIAGAPDRKNTPISVPVLSDPYILIESGEKKQGLDFSFVHETVKRLDGKIRIRCNENGNPGFQILFPVVSTFKNIEIKKPVLNLKGTETILFVDDEILLTDVIWKFLAPLGYSLHTFTDSLKAFETFKTNPEKFDLIITDMTMPKMTGLELAKKAKKIKKHIPIILCSGFSELITEKKAESLGINAFIMKPIIRNELATSIRQVFDDSLNEH